MLLDQSFFNPAPMTVGADIPQPGMLAELFKRLPNGAGAQFEPPPGMENQATLPQAAVPVAAPAPMPAPALPETSLWGRLSRGLDDNSTMLMALGAGIAGGRNIGEGLSRGFSGAAQASLLDDKTKAARLGQTATHQALIARGLPPDLALAASANPAILQSILPTMFGAKDAPKTIEVQGRTLQWDPQTKNWAAVQIPNANNQQQQFNLDPKAYEGPRKEFQSLPPIKKWDDSVSIYQSMSKSAPLATPASDLDMVYGLAKLLDPESVVREGEFKTVQNSSAIPEQIKGQLQYLIEGKGKLTAEQRSQIMEIAYNRMSSYHEEADMASKRYTEIAGKFNLDPSLIVRKIEPPKKWKADESTETPIGPGNYIYDPKQKKVIPAR